MITQGVALSYLYSRSEWARRSTLGSLQFAWLAGGFLVSYIALAEAAKYTIPAILPWLGTEIAAGFVQFTLYGVLLGFIDARQRESPSAAAA